MSQSELTSELMSDFAATDFIVMFVALNHGYPRGLAAARLCRPRQIKKVRDRRRNSPQCLQGDDEAACPALRGGMYK